MEKKGRGSGGRARGGACRANLSSNVHSLTPFDARQYETVTFCPAFAYGAGTVTSFFAAS